MSDKFRVGDEVTVWLTGFTEQSAVVTSVSHFGMYLVAIEFPVTAHQMRPKTAAAKSNGAGQRLADARKRSSRRRAADRVTAAPTAEGKP